MSPGRIDWPSIRLAPVEARDLPKINSWQNDPEIRDLIMGFRGPIRVETTAEWISNINEQNLKSRTVFAIIFGDNLSGIVQLQNIDWIHRVATLGIYVGDSEARGNGLGYAATALILDYAFFALDLHRVALDVLASNLPAVRLYRSLGFVREGVLRSAYSRSGRREDVEIHALLKQDWAVTLPAEARRLVCPA